MTPDQVESEPTTAEEYGLSDDMDELAWQSWIDRAMKGDAEWIRELAQQWLAALADLEAAEAQRDAAEKMLRAQHKRPCVATGDYPAPPSICGLECVPCKTATYLKGRGNQ